MIVRLERVHHRRLAVRVPQAQIATGRHQHVTDAAVLGAGRLVQRRLAAVRGAEIRWDVSISAIVGRYIPATFLPGIVHHVDDRVRCVRDQVLDDVAVAVLAAVVQRRLAGGVDRQQRVALHVQLFQLDGHTNWVEFS